LVGVLDEECAQGRVVVDRIGSPELVPGGAAASEPGAADVLGLLGFDGAGCELGLALGGVGPDEGGSLLSFAVVQDRLDGARHRWQVGDDLLPDVGSQRPVA
jgi:hypothetical protein